MAQTGFLGVLGGLLVVFGVLMFLKTIMFGGAALVALAIALLAAHFVGAAGRWALWLGALFGLLAVPWLLGRLVGWTLFFMASLVKLLPFLLLGFGVYLVVRAVSRR